MHKTKTNIVLYSSLLLYSFLFETNLFSQKFTKNNLRKEITISLSFPKLAYENIVSTKCKDSSIDMIVILKNLTDSIASFYDDWNTWGFYNISFEIATSDTIYKLIRLKSGWDKNFPSFTTLLPGDSLVLKYNILGSVCDSLEFFARMPQHSIDSAKIKAIYQLEMENHLAVIRDLIPYKDEKGRKKAEKIIRSFVKDKLISKEYQIKFEADDN